MADTDDPLLNLLGAARSVLVQRLILASWLPGRGVFFRGKTDVSRPKTVEDDYEVWLGARPLLAYEGQGKLPRWISDVVLRREQARPSDTTLRDFIDIFYDSATRLVADTEEATIVPFARDLARRKNSLDSFSWFTLNLLGLASVFEAVPPDQWPFDPDAVVALAGLLVVQPPTAAVLGQILTTVLGVDVEVVEQAELPPATIHPIGECDFRLRIGPLRWSQQLRFHPFAEGFVTAVRWARLYAGTELEFDVELIHGANDFPAETACGLDSSLLDWSFVLDANRRPTDDPVGHIAAELVRRVDGQRFCPREEGSKP